MTRERAIELMTRFKDVCYGDEDLENVLEDMTDEEKEFVGIPKETIYYYELWVDGCCIHESEAQYDNDGDAWDDAKVLMYELLSDEYKGWDADDFEIEIKER